ncbi:hypothetical protein F7725_023308 [Dissostichus mawsoni]|uniref:Uncharacterized protein n=1 Tax=Dissostichus mawsoni TaxID=36200 RepID=A0A7J5Z1B2_DISMA|nr:hypothetical protein F7725_023308 [Dissostichus mawsoni]
MKQRGLLIGVVVAADHSCCTRHTLGLLLSACQHCEVHPHRTFLLLLLRPAKTRARAKMEFTTTGATQTHPCLYIFLSAFFPTCVGSSHLKTARSRSSTWRVTGFGEKGGGALRTARARIWDVSARQQQCVSAGCSQSVCGETHSFQVAIN